MRNSLLKQRGVPRDLTLREGKASGQAVSLLTLKGDFTLGGGTAEDMAELVTMFHSGLRERSQYAVTLKDADGQGQRIGLYPPYVVTAELSLLGFLIAAKC